MSVRGFFRGVTGKKDSFLVGLMMSLLVLVVNFGVIDLLRGSFGGRRGFSGLSPDIGDFVIDFVVVNLGMLLYVVTLAGLNMPSTAVVALFNSYTLTMNLTLRNKLSGLTNNLVVLVFGPFGMKSCVDTGKCRKCIGNVAVFCAYLIDLSGGMLRLPGNGLSGDRVAGCAVGGLEVLSVDISMSCSSSVGGMGSILSGITGDCSLVLGGGSVGVELGRVTSSSLVFVFET